jgi:hypothetical protein
VESLKFTDYLLDLRNPWIARGGFYTNVKSKKCIVGKSVEFSLMEHNVDKLRSILKYGPPGGGPWLANCNPNELLTLIVEFCAHPGNFPSPFFIHSCSASVSSPDSSLYPSLDSSLDSSPI